MDGLEGDAPTEFYKVERCLAGTPPFGLHPCLYYNVPTGLLFGWVRKG